MKKKILIIEDDSFFRELITKKLFSGGFSISEAPDGKLGLEKIEKLKPDLILLDLLLPNIDGFEVLERLKGNPETEKIPIIILSNLSQKEDIQKGMEMGAEDFLIKSNFALDEIIDKVQRFLK